MIYQLQIRRGTLINDDPQRRCYDGCYFKSHWEWSEWERWTDYEKEEWAKTAVRLFAREDQQLRVVEITGTVTE